MRRICYAVAMSLDGYVAGPNGEADWIFMDPEIDFKALFARFDTVFVGRRTVGVSVIPGLLGGGIPLLPSPAGREKLRLISHKVYKTGIVALEYAVGSQEAGG